MLMPAKGRMACGRFLVPALEAHPSICLARAKQQRKRGMTPHGVGNRDAVPAMRYSVWRR